MSLLSSIFGQKVEDSELSTLFDKRGFPSKKRSRESSKSENDDNVERELQGDDDNNNDNSDGDKNKIKKTNKQILLEGNSDSDNGESSDSNNGSDHEGSDDDENMGQQQPDDKRWPGMKTDGKSDKVKGKTRTGIMDNENVVGGNSESEMKKSTPSDRKEQQQQQQQQQNDSQTVGRPDDADGDDRTVFVGNLPNTFTRKMLEKLFRPCGPIESTRIRSVATTGVKLPQASAGNQKLVKKISVNINKVDTDVKPSIVGYVVFQQHGNISKTIEKALLMNNSTVQDPETKLNRTIRVDHTKSEFDSSRSIFVGNLPYRTDEETLRHHFVQGCDIQDIDIEGVRVVRDKENYQCKGFAYILFRDKTLVATALRRMHGSSYMNRELRVLVCTRRYKTNQAETTRRLKKKKLRSDDSNVNPGVAALRRIMEKETRLSNQKNKRARGKKTSTKPTVKKAGVSRRTAAEAKANKRVKKIQKRITKGMGKSKQG